ncbi:MULTISPECIES: lysophospholipid acyltransferase family protein [Crateriforma]|uniref:Phospholipid/glycerol acyltransferase domain-containing protein n=1 Tax=Crateriforma conspicua TaxID=2527996 RepID=A0A5C6FYC6_9PLAN|nr:MULTISPECIES: lysophospholipid acyltransferase family protein [Crateriforma]TWU67541.1 hypothetical protein V7x_31150 [Crateriforma conspicua]
MTKSRSDQDDHLPPIPAWFQDGFHRFLKPYLRRHFHAIAIESDARSSLNVPSDVPLIVYANHPSWWDPLIAHFVNRVSFPGRQFWAPIDADALRQYEVFKKLGFFGVQLNSKSGAADFLKTSQLALHHHDDQGNCDGALWVTPEGRFCDPRDHTAALMPGLSHLCQRLSSGYVLPLVMEYAFWDERLPMCLLTAGQVMDVSQHPDWDKTLWNQRLTESMRSAQDRLAGLVVDRDSGPFTNLLAGKKGTGGLYDWLRRSKSMLTGKRFKATHGDQFS